MTLAGELVGRDQELSLALDTLLGRNDAALLVIAGEAGIGKTHLLGAAAETAVSQGLVVLAGGCLNLREELPYLPIVDVIRELATCDDGRLLKAVFAACPAYVRQEITRLAPDLDQADGGGDEVSVPVDQWHRQRLFGAVRLLLTELAELAPVGVVIEDVHWADPSTQDLLRYLAAPSHHTGVPLLLTSRAEDLATSWLQDLGSRDRTKWLELGPLDANETGELARALRARSDAEVATIFHRSGGNPLFVQHLAVSGVPDSLPTSLTALLLRRLSGLEPIELELVRAMSVAGRGLDDAALSVLVDRPAREVADGLRSLTARLLVGRAGAGGHQLRHALLAEAVRAQMTITESQQVHRSVADTLARRQDPSIAGQIAEHFAAAGDTTAESTWRLRAARYADSVAAPVEASLQWRRVVDLLDHLRNGPATDDIDEIEIYQSAIAAWQRIGDTASAAALAEHTLHRLLAQATPTEQVGLYLVAGQLRAVKDLPGGMVLLEQAVALGADLPPSAEYVSALHQLAQAHNALSHGDYAWQAELMGRALAAARAGRLQSEEKLLSAAVAWRLMAQCDRKASFELLDRATAIVPDRTDPLVELKVAVYATDIALKFGELTRVVDIGTPALDAARTDGYQDTFEAGLLLSNICESLRELGAIDRIPGYVDGVADRAATRESAAVHSEVAALRVAQGDLAAARQFWEEYADVFNGWDLQFDREFTLVRGEFMLWDGRPADVVPETLSLLQGVCRTDEGAMAGGLFVLGLRACADVATRARRIADTDAVARAVADAGRLDRLIDQCRESPFRSAGVPATATADHASWLAEWARCHGRDSSDLWGKAASSWTSLDRPHRAAYALWRQADRLLADPHTRGRAAPVLRAAAHAAQQHLPLTDALATLALRARIDLVPVPVTAPEPPMPARPQPFGLTPRELAVINLVAQGLTNREIGASLYISTKTASVHVSNILVKMGVTSRVHAAAVAAQTGILRPATPANDHAR